MIPLLRLSYYDNRIIPILLVFKYLDIAVFCFVLGTRGE